MFLETSLINFGFSLKVKINRFRQNYQLHSRFLRRTEFLFTKSYTRNSLLKHFQANNVFEVLTDVDGDSLAQWFLTGGRQNFLGGAGPYASYNMVSLINTFANEYTWFYSLFKVRRAWNKRQLLKGGVVEKRLRSPGFVGAVSEGESKSTSHQTDLLLSQVNRREPQVNRVSFGRIGDKCQGPLVAISRRQVIPIDVMQMAEHWPGIGKLQKNNGFVTDLFECPPSPRLSTCSLRHYFLDRGSTAKILCFVQRFLTNDKARKGFATTHCQILRNADRGIDHFRLDFESDSWNFLVFSPMLN